MRCHRHFTEVGAISWQGNCQDCGQRELAANVLGLHHKTGYPFRRWRRAMAASVGGVLLDDSPPSA